MHPDVAYAMSAFREGASGYVLKNSAPVMSVNYNSRLTTIKFPEMKNF
jgi:hypothetical protein